MQYQAFESGIEINGQTVWAIVDGFKMGKALPSKFLAEQGVGHLDDKGLIVVEQDVWYSQEGWLAAFEKIASKAGPRVLNSIGLKIPENAEFPPWVVDVESAVRSIDIAYHMNHRKGGAVMFDGDSGEMLDGIGHYGFEPVEGENRIISVCENPSPCISDIGIITAMARRFAPAARVSHDRKQPCRKKGADSCTYVITW